MAYFPAMINLERKPVLVVGGNSEGLKKIRILKDFGAVITLIAQEAFFESVELSEVYHQKKFEDSDFERDDYALIVAATNDRDVNNRIYELANDKRILINVVDDIELCTFIFPAIVRDEDVVCAVSSSGKSPYVAKHLKDLIQNMLPKNIGAINNQMGLVRKKVKAEIPDISERKKILLEEFNSLIK